MDENILYMFEYWANPVVHLLLLKSSMNQVAITAANHSLRFC